MRLLGRLHLVLWLTALGLFVLRHCRFAAEPVAGLANPRLSVAIEPTADLLWLALLLLGTLTAAFVMLSSEQTQASLKRLRQDVESLRASVDRSKPPPELPRLKAAIRSGDLAGIEANATWSALVFEDGKSLSPYELALIHGRADVIAVLSKAYRRQGLAYRLVEWAD
jgi:HAMP domain-containing protein